MSAPKRTSGRIRREHAGQGALLLKFTLPADSDWEQPVCAGLQPLVDAMLAQRPVVVVEQTAERRNFGTMQRKGYRITTDTGCCSPEPQYRWSAGENARGYARSYVVMHGTRPTAAAVGPDPVTGRAETLQLSHLCKRGHSAFGCSNRRHIRTEAQWRNALRNFCFWVGENQDGDEWPPICACTQMLMHTRDSLAATGHAAEAAAIAACVGDPCLRPYRSAAQQEAEQPAFFPSTADGKAACMAFMTKPNGKGGEYVQAPDGTEIDSEEHPLKVCWEDEATLKARDAASEKRMAAKIEKKRKGILEGVLEAYEERGLDIID